MAQHRKPQSRPHPAPAVTNPHPAREITATPQHSRPQRQHRIHWNPTHITTRALSQQPEQPCPKRFCLNRQKIRTNYCATTAEGFVSCAEGKYPDFAITVRFGRSTFTSTCRYFPSINGSCV